jgi:hypothetical protein
VLVPEVVVLNGGVAVAPLPNRARATYMVNRVASTVLYVAIPASSNAPYADTYSWTVASCRSPTKALPADQCLGPKAQDLFRDSFVKIQENGIGSEKAVTLRLADKRSPGLTITEVEIVSGPVPLPSVSPSVALRAAGSDELVVNFGRWSLGGAEAPRNASVAYGLQASEGFSLAYAFKVRLGRAGTDPLKSTQFAYVSEITSETELPLPIPAGVGPMEIIVSVYSL